MKSACIGYLLASFFAESSVNVTVLERARTLFEAGNAAYQAAQYAEAARALEEAYRLLPDPAIQFSAAQAHRKQFFVDRDPNRLERAVQLYRGYLKAVGRQGRRAEAVEQLEVLEAQRSTLHPETSVPAPPLPETQLMVHASVATASVSVDDGPWHVVPLLAAVSPGLHRIRAQAKGHASRELTALAVEARLMPVRVELSELPAVLDLRAPLGAEVRLDRRRLGTTPLGSTKMGGGRHRLLVLAAGKVPFQRDFSVEPGGVFTLDAPLEDTVQRRVSIYSLWASAGLGALSLAGSGLTLFYQSRAVDVRNDVFGANSKNIDPQMLLDYQADTERRDAFRTASIMLGTGAVLGAIIGVVLYLADAPQVF